ncbi:cation diffusion facilitator family transporter [Undibacter mobilis]|uniref:Cation transporter n=1 Tax=Undibacter mobilis TaxID=2292256 RepID=A0A371B3G0_9BRAD|nr:cation diffusion facilitator family transporter [Undibacter mobilis]RDV02118.1 cation transporter [Undibacter mobilis]
MQREKEYVALTSIAASAGLTIAKAIVGFSTGSLAILSEAGHSLIDCGAAIMTYVAVRVSGKPADEEHHYGHGKVESVSALGETALLFLLSGVVIWEAVMRLLNREPHNVVANYWAFGVIIASIVVDYYRARALTRTAKKTQSQALEADALHFSSDMWSSGAVLIGLVGVWYGFGWADSVSALVVAALVCIAGWRLGRRTIETLTDTAPKGAAETITHIVSTVPGVVAVEQVRARDAGDKTFVDVTVAVNRALPLERVAEIKAAIAAALAANMPRTEASVTTDPVAIDDETIVDRVMVIARNRALAVHHVTVHSLQDKLAVALDLEVDGKLTLAEAHDIADGLEDAIAGDLGTNVEVDTHIEPLQPGDASGREAPPERVTVVEAALKELAAADKALRNIHAVRVRETNDGEIVNFHCHVDPDMTVLAVHDKVDALERALKVHSSLIKRVIGHAEPMR